jgi:hypothetical protein
VKLFWRKVHFVGKRKEREKNEGDQENKKLSFLLKKTGADLFIMTCWDDHSSAVLSSFLLPAYFTPLKKSDIITKNSARKN